MIITCPHCQTRYQVTYEAIGAAGRKVQCATCNEAWQQDPPTSAEELQNDRLEQEVDEDKLDEAFSEEEHRVAAEVAKKLATEERRHEPERRPEPDHAEPAKVDPAVQRKRQRAFSRRQNSLFAQLPMARLRRAARVVGAVLLTAMLLIGYLGRNKVVELFPAMAGLYGAVGLKVNVVGLDFADVNTLRTLVDGKEVLMVSARIVGLMADPVVVPQVVVTLIGPDGSGIYEWSVRAGVGELKLGQSVDLKTQLTLPPGNIARVKLAFVGGTGGQNNAPADAPATQEIAPKPEASAAPKGEHH